MDHRFSEIYLVRACSSADSLQNGLVSNLGEVSTLNVGSNTVQRSSQCVLRRGVHHLGSDWSSVRRPGEENNLGSLSFASANVVLKVVDGILALVFWQLLQESVVVFIAGGFLHDDFGFLVVQSENDELELLAQLQIVESGQ